MFAERAVWVLIPKSCCRRVLCVVWSVGVCVVSVDGVLNVTVSYVRYECLFRRVRVFFSSLLGQILFPDQHIDKVTRN